MPRQELLYLTVEAVERIHEQVLAAHGGTPGLRDGRLLESAVGAPQASFGGQFLLKDGVEIAAAYLSYICCNHPFVDGNKRTALASCLVFLEVNGMLEDAELPSREIDACCDVVSTHSSTDSWLCALALASLGGRVPIVRTRHISAPVPRNVLSRWLYSRAKLLRDEDLRARLGEAARRRCANDFSYHRMLDRMEAIYSVAAAANPR